MKFNEVLEALKQGKSIRGSEWAKDTQMYLRKGAFDGAVLGFDGEQPQYPHGSTITAIDMGLFEAGDSGIITRLPSIEVSCNNVIFPYTPTIYDILAEDWVIVE